MKRVMSFLVFTMFCEVGLSNLMANFEQQRIARVCASQALGISHEVREKLAQEVFTPSNIDKLNELFDSHYKVGFQFKHTNADIQTLAELFISRVLGLRQNFDEKQNTAFRQAVQMSCGTKSPAQKRKFTRESFEDATTILIAQFFKNYWEVRDVSKYWDEIAEVIGCSYGWPFVKELLALFPSEIDAFLDKLVEMNLGDKVEVLQVESAVKKFIADAIYDKDKRWPYQACPANYWKPAFDRTVADLAQCSSTVGISAIVLAAFMETLEADGYIDPVDNVVMVEN